MNPNEHPYDGLSRLGSDIRNLTKRYLIAYNERPDVVGAQKSMGAQKGALIIVCFKLFIFFNILTNGLSPAFAPTFVPYYL
ncbi:hypothetical protein C1O30_02105 [Dickeya zeae]|nr:hypothetical protein C1O30_02105 [Dickeya zeae]